MPGQDRLAMPGFRVTAAGVRQVLKDAAGNDGVYYSVSYELADGTPGELWIPESQWVPELAAEAVKADIETTWRVLHMSSGSG